MNRDDTPPQFYNVISETEYTVEVLAVDKIEDVSNNFMTREELQEKVGPEVYLYEYKPYTQQHYRLDQKIKDALKYWANKLEASGKASIVIDDEDLLSFLRSSYYRVQDFLSDDFARRKNKLTYNVRRRRKKIKTKPSKSDARHFWYALEHAFRITHGVYPGYIKARERTAKLFIALSPTIGWKAFRSCLKAKDTETIKFYRMIWNKPQEYFLP